MTEGSSSITFTNDCFSSAFGIGSLFTGEASRLSRFSSDGFAASNMFTSSCYNKKTGLLLGRDRLLATVSYSLSSRNSKKKSTSLLPKEEASHKHKIAMDGLRNILHKRIPKIPTFKNPVNVTSPRAQDGLQPGQPPPADAKHDKERSVSLVPAPPLSANEQTRHRCSRR